MSSSSARISISSDEVNLLVYRYLIEAGFKHSAFVFHGESLLSRSPNILQSDMPPGTLVTLLQKALLFLYVETHVANDGQTIQCDDAFSLLKPHDHDHGPLDAQIQFDESIADHVDIGGKPSSSTETDAPPSKKVKQSKSQKPNGDSVDQIETRDHVMADAEKPAGESVSHEGLLSHANATDEQPKAEETKQDELPDPL